MMTKANVAIDIEYSLSIYRCFIWSQSVYKQFVNWQTKGPFFCSANPQDTSIEIGGFFLFYLYKKNCKEIGFIEAIHTYKSSHNIKKYGSLFTKRFEKQRFTKVVQLRGKGYLLCVYQIEKGMVGCFRTK